MEIKSSINDCVIIEHPTIKGLFVKLTTTPNSVKAECFNRHMTIADYNTKTHTYGGAVYFFNGEPTDRNGELRNTNYFFNMQKRLEDQALKLEEREKELNRQAMQLRSKELDLERREQERDRGRQLVQVHPEDKFVFKLQDGNKIILRRKDLAETVLVNLST